MSVTAWQRRPPDAYWKQNDTAPALAEQLFDGTGAPAVLTGATVKFVAQFPGGTSAKINANATITDAATGKVSYTPVAADTDTVGDLMAEWQVTYSGGQLQTWPNSTWQKIRIKDDVAS